MKGSPWSRPFNIGPRCFAISVPVFVLNDRLWRVPHPARVQCNKPGAGRESGRSPQSSATNLQPVPRRFGRHCRKKLRPMIPGSLRSVRSPPKPPKLPISPMNPPPILPPLYLFPDHCPGLRDCGTASYPRSVLHQPGWRGGQAHDHVGDDPDRGILFVSAIFGVIGRNFSRLVCRDRGERD